MISNAVLLFFVIDPFGLIPVYVALLGRVPPERRLPILVRELLIALLALVLFLSAGRYVLAALHISEPALLIGAAGQRRTSSSIDLSLPCSNVRSAGS